MPKASNPNHTTLLDTWGRRNRKHGPRLCDACGKSFLPIRASSRFCSRPCQWSKNGGHNRKAESWWTNTKGYVEGRVWVNGRRITVKRHRWIVEQSIGRRLLPYEDVHHINGDKSDNRLENLKVVLHGAHSAITNAGRSYRRGYSLNLTPAERLSRQRRAKESNLAAMGRAAITKATHP